MLSSIPDTGLIIAAATGYPLPTIAPFVGSALRRTRADVLLLIESGQRDIQTTFAGEPRLHTLRVKQKGASQDMVVNRFFAVRQLLSQLVGDASLHSQGQAAPVLLSDARDVLFQADPFDHPARSVRDVLILAEESARIQDCIDNSTWLETLFGAALLEQISDRPILCAGTILGPAPLLLSLLERLCALMQERRQACPGTLWGLDQAALNALIHAPDLDLPVVLEGSEAGRFLTVHHEAGFRLDAAGRVVNRAGQAFAVIHQHDRLPWLERHLQALLPSI